jgi:endonuclease-3
MLKKERFRRFIDYFTQHYPATVEALQTLPGVGRKTAHVILSIVYNEPTMAVDTHVFRVSHRLGLAPLTATTPLAVEKALMAHIPKLHVPKAHHWLILHGRYVCIARAPKCNICDLREFCKYYEKGMRIQEG